MTTEADGQAEQALQLSALISPVFGGRQPGVIGSVLADLMATFLCNHKIPDDVVAEHDLRQKILAQWCETVWQVVAVNDSGPMQ